MRNLPIILSALICLSSAIVARAASLDAVVTKQLEAAGLSRVSHASEVSPKERANKSYTYRTRLREPEGSAYVIVTDMDDTYSGSIQKLVNAHSGTVIHLRSFRNLVSEPKARQYLFEQLQKSKPKYVALVPRIENFSENVVLATMTVLAQLGGDSVNVYPAFMTGVDPASFDALVDRSLGFQSKRLHELSPFIFAQSTKASAGGVRALEKAMFFNNLFTALGDKPNGLVMRTPEAIDDQVVGTIPFPEVETGPAGKIMNLPAASANALARSNMIVMFGHGHPGMTCSVDVSALRDIPMQNDVILCGSCFSAAPVFSDDPSIAASKDKRSAPFFRRAIANGVTVFYGHMHENSGFPQLFVVADALMSGETVGQSFQRVINANMSEVRVPIDRWIMTDEQLNQPEMFERRNDLLYVMIGDPAVRPIAD